VGVLGAARSDAEQLLCILLVVLSLACVVSGLICSWTAVVCSKAAKPSRGSVSGEPRKMGSW